jgi:hypothetical protein
VRHKAGHAHASPSGGGLRQRRQKKQGEIHNNAIHTPLIAACYNVNGSLNDDRETNELQVIGPAAKSKHASSESIVKVCMRVMQKNNYSNMCSVERVIGYKS